MVNTEIRLIIFFAAEDGEALYSKQKQDWELTGSDHELLIAKFRLKLKRLGITTRPFRYDLNQIPYEYTVEVRNIFKGLDLIDSLMNYGPRFVTLSSHLFQILKFVVIHTVQGFGIANKAEVDIFLELSCFFDDPTDVGNLISDSSAFSKSSLNIWKFTVQVLLKTSLENFEHYIASV